MNRMVAPRPLIASDAEWRAVLHSESLGLSPRGAVSVAALALPAKVRGLCVPTGSAPSTEL